MATFPIAIERLAGRSGFSFPLVGTIAHMVRLNISLLFNWRIRDIRTKFIFGSSLMDNEVSRVIYEDFLPKALAEGHYVAAPDH